MKILLLAKNKEWADSWIYDNKMPKNLVQYVSRPENAYGLNNLPYVVTSHGPYEDEIINILSWGKCYEISKKQAKGLI